MSPKTVEKLIKANPNEDFPLLTDIEKILISKRGYAFRMPPPGNKVVSLMSGGLDTIVMMAILMEKYQLELYPVHFVKTWPGDSPKNTLSATRFFDQYFAKRYPLLYHHVKIMPLSFPPEILKKDLDKTVGRILDSKTGKRQGIPFEPSVYAYSVINYIYTLPQKVQDQLRTIFMGTLAANVVWYSYESLTSYRAMTLEICTMLADFSWQVTSYPIEKELGLYLGKEEMIQAGAALNIPLEKTSTCRHPYKYHCGYCHLCYNRRRAFKNVSITDLTIYEDERKDVVGRLKRHFPFKLILKHF